MRGDLVNAIDPATRALHSERWAGLGGLFAEPEEHNDPARLHVPPRTAQTPQPSETSSETAPDRCSCSAEASGTKSGDALSVPLASSSA
jgi:hypothetical protein